MQALVQPVPSAHTTTIATRAQSALPVRVEIAAAVAPALQRAGPVEPVHGTMIGTRLHRVCPARTARRAAEAPVPNRAARQVTKLALDCERCGGWGKGEDLQGGSPVCIVCGQL